MTSSLAARLTLWYAVSAFLLVAGATTALYLVLVTNVDRQDDDFLVDTIQILRALMRERPGDIGALQQEVEWEDAARRYARFYIRIKGADGRTVVETSGADAVLAGQRLIPATVADDPGPGIDVTVGQGVPFRMVAAVAHVGGGGESRLIEAALDRSVEQRLLHEYRLRLWSVLGLALFVAVAAGYAIAWRGLRPVTAIAATASSVGLSTLGTRIPMAGLPTELAGLATTFNDMFARLEDGFRQLSSFSADLAHELRTPISTLRGQMEVTLGRSRDAGEYRHSLESMLEDCVRLSTVVDGLLFLARADGPGTALLAQSIDVWQELAAVVDLHEAAAAEAGVQLRAATGDDAIVASVDRTLFQRALSNLIVNSVKHTPPGGRVDVGASSHGESLEINVSDTGCGIPEPHLSRVGERFYRVDPSRSSASGGLGLGLAIVKSIMKVHGGTMHVMSEQHTGTTVRLTFPAALQTHQTAVFRSEAQIA